jgi:acyl-CoA thioesterase
LGGDKVPPEPEGESCHCAPGARAWALPVVARVRIIAALQPKPSRMSSLNAFSSLVARRSASGDGVRFVIGQDWLQGRTCYGGLVSAMAVQAMRDRAGAGWPPDTSLRALQTSFVGPVAAGPLDVAVSVLRQGRNVCQVLAQVMQDARVAAVLLGVFSADRASAMTPRRPQRPPSRREAEDLPVPPELPAQAPAFLRHFDLRWAEGAPPFSGSEGWHTSIHMRLKLDEAASVSSEMQTVLLADLSATPAISQLARPAANSSVSWALELRPVGECPAAGWWRADNESLMVDGGYVNQSARLWAPSGELAAFGNQLVAVFA